MARKSILAIVLLAIGAPVCAQDLPGGGPVPLLYLHPLVNYGFDPEWTRDWERGLQSGNSLRVNVGSVSTSDFLTDIELHLTEPIASRFRVLYDLRWFEALHVETRDAGHFLGFGLVAMDGLELQGQAHPAPDKEELDLRFGILLHDESREQYARVLVRWEDPLFEDKNDVEGLQGQVATSLEWTARGVAGRFEAFTQGLYGSGWERSYPDAGPVPEPLADSRRLNGSVSRVRGLFGAGRFAEIEFAHHEYEASATARATGVVDRYDNRVVNLVLRGVWQLNQRWRARGELHRVDQSASAPDFDYERRDWMPATWLRYAFGRVHSIEIGYMGTGYDWTGSPYAAESEDGYRQKLELAWLIQPSRRARVQLSLAHEPDPQKFGGGNVQLQLGF